MAFRNSLHNFARPQANRSRPKLRLALESLEQRDVPTVGALDSTFNLTGHKEFEFLGAADAEKATGVAVQNDGKIVAVGTFIFNNGAVSNFAVVRFNTNGTLDTSFGNGGRVTIDVAGGTNEQATCVALQPDGKIVVGGFVTFAGDDDFAMARLTTAGALDTTFDTDGVRTFNFAGGGTNNDQCFGVAVQQVSGANKIVLVGSSDQTTAGQGINFAILRLNDNGSTDLSFNSNVGGGDIARAAAIDSLNRIVVGGFTNTGGVSNNFAIARFTTVGAFDPAFNSGAARIVDFGFNDEIRALVVLPDNRIVAAGFDDGGSADFALVRLTEGGLLDTTFNDLAAPTAQNGDGKLSFTFGASTFGGVERATGLALQPDGKLLVSGFTDAGGITGNPNNFAVARITTAGVLDTTFDTDGKATYDFGGDDQANALAFDKKGHAVLAGFRRSSGAGSTNDFEIARINALNLISTAGVFDPASATWFLRNSNTPGAPDAGLFQYGPPGATPVTGDWNGDGSATIGVVDSSLTWLLRNSNSSGAPDAGVFQFGGPGFKPLVGDWDGDGVPGIGVFDPRTATFFLKNTVGGGFPEIVIPFGGANWIPIVGDWNGDGITTIGVFDPTTAVWYLRNSNTPGLPDAGQFQFGGPGWKPVVGDWDGNNTTTIGVFDPTGSWFLRNANNGGLVDIPVFSFGAGIWTPVAGDWNHPAAPLLAANLGTNPLASLTDAQLQGAVSSALALLRKADVDRDIVNALAQVNYSVAPLPGLTLGLAYENANRVVIDADAAGHSWFIDRTPFQTGKRFDGREDLLSAVLHEMGHMAGLEHDELHPVLTAGFRDLSPLEVLLARGKTRSK